MKISIEMIIKIGIAFCILCVAVLVFLGNCSAFGKDPSGEHLRKISKSSRYNSDKKEFVNRRVGILDEMRSRNSQWKLIGEFLWGGGKYRKPSHRLPEEKPDWKEFLRKSEFMKFIWFGHSTFIVNIDGNILLFDPVFSESAAPFSFMVKRFQDAVVSLEELPEIDYIFISHDHYDHLDEKTIRFFQKKKTKFLTPLGVTSHLKEWGIQEDRLTELDWWEEISINGMKIICGPAQHFSGRKGWNGNQTLWGSWIVKGKSESFFFSGDSGYDTHFKEIGDAHGPFTISFIENGQYNEMWKEVHVLPEETAKAFLELKGKKLVPVHWAMFDLSLHDWYEPVEMLEKYAEENQIDLLTPKFGEIVYSEKPNPLVRWWKSLVEK